MQRAVAVGIGVIDGAAAVQCATAQSKRWYHAGGRLPSQLALIIAAETVLQCCVVGYLYADSAPALFALRTGGFFALGIASLRLVPLHAQRPLSVLLFFCGAVLSSEQAGLLPPTPGAEWMLSLLGVKYLLSHVPRHEPYALR